MPNDDTPNTPNDDAPNTPNDDAPNTPIGGAPKPKRKNTLDQIVRQIAGRDQALMVVLTREGLALLHEAVPSSKEKTGAQALDETIEQLLQAKLGGFAQGYEHAQSFVRDAGCRNQLLASTIDSHFKEPILRVLQPSFKQAADGELPSGALDELNKLRLDYKELVRLCEPDCTQIRAAAMEIASAKSALRDSLDGIGVEVSVTGRNQQLQAGKIEATLEPLDVLLRVHFPTLRDAFDKFCPQVHQLVGEIAVHDRTLRAELVPAGESVIARAYYASGVSDENFGLVLDAALRDHLAHMPSVLNDIWALSNVCSDISKKRIQKHLGRVEDDGRGAMIALTALTNVRNADANGHYVMFRAVYSRALDNDLRKASEKELPGGGQSNGIDAPFDLSPHLDKKIDKIWDLKRQASTHLTVAARDFSKARSAPALTVILDKMIESMWSLAVRRRAIARLTLSMWHAEFVLDADAKKLPENHEDWISRLVEAFATMGEPVQNPRNRINGLLSKVRKDVTGAIADACAAAGCEDVAETLSTLTLMVIAPYERGRSLNLSPRTLPSMKVAREKLASVSKTPEWLLLLITWLIGVFEGGLR